MGGTCGTGTREYQNHGWSRPLVGSGRSTSGHVLSSRLHRRGIPTEKVRVPAGLDHDATGRLEWRGVVCEGPSISFTIRSERKPLEDSLSQRPRNADRTRDRGGSPSPLWSGRYIQCANFGECLVILISGFVLFSADRPEWSAPGSAINVRIDNG